MRGLTYLEADVLRASLPGNHREGSEEELACAERLERRKLVTSHVIEKRWVDGGRRKLVTRRYEITALGRIALTCCTRTP